MERAKHEVTKGQASLPRPPSLMSLPDAAAALGYPTADSLRRAFVRAVLPGQFLLRLGRRTLRVDVAGLVDHLRAQAEARVAGAPEE